MHNGHIFVEEWVSLNQCYVKLILLIHKLCQTKIGLLFDLVLATPACRRLVGIVELSRNIVHQDVSRSICRIHLSHSNYCPSIPPTAIGMEATSFLWECVASFLSVHDFDVCASGCWSIYQSEPLRGVRTLALFPHEGKFEHKGCSCHTPGGQRHKRSGYPSIFDYARSARCAICGPSRRVWTPFFPY